MAGFIRTTVISNLSDAGARYGRTGLIDELINEISTDWESFLQKEASDEAVEYKRGLESTLKLL